MSTTETGTPAKAHGQAAFAFIFVTVMLDILALGVIIPVLPKLLVQFEGGDMAGAATVAGVFGFTWAAMQFAFAPLVGALSDRFGRRPVVLLSNLGLGLDYVLMALAPTLPWLFVGRVISGITTSSFPTAGAYIADVTPPEHRAAKFGMLGAAFGLGFIVGPALGGLLGSIHLRLPFWASAVLSLANFGYGYFVLPESLAPDKRRAFSWKAANPFGSLKFLREHPAVIGLIIGVFLYNFAHESLPSVFVLYTDYRYGWTARQEGIVLCVLGACSTAVSALLVGPTVRKLGERLAMFAGLSFGTLGFALYAMAPTGRIFLAGMPLMALWAIAGPAMQAQITRHIPPTEQGQIQGALGSLKGITGMIGPLLFTQVFAAAIGSGTGPKFSGAPYLIASCLLATSLAWSWFATRPAPVPSEE